MTRAMHRRRFLTAAAAAPLGLPFLSQFASAREVAERRVIFLMSPNDAMRREEWAMAEQGQSAALPEALPSYLAPLSAFRDRMSVFGDLSKLAEHESHCPQTLLTGVDTLNGNGDTNAASMSLDQHLADILEVDAATFGVRCLPNDPSARWSSRGADQPVDPIMDPGLAFEQYFGDFDADPAELEAKRARKRSVLDRVAKDLSRFQSQLASHQRPRVEAHLESIRKLEADIDTTIVGACNPVSPTFGQDALDNASVPTSLHGLVDMMVQVMGCGVTRVGTLQFGRSGAGEIRPVWPEFGINIDRDCHFGLAHRYWDDPSDEATTDRRAQESWVSTHMVQRLLEGLEATPDADGNSLLDNTMVVWLHEMGSNHNAGGHMAAVFGGPSWLQTGSFHSMPGRSLNDLLTAVSNKMGVQTEQWGTPAYNAGPLPL